MCTWDNRYVTWTVNVTYSNINNETIKIVLCKRTRRNQGKHLAFIDLVKAYDSMPVCRLWLTMRNIGINDSLDMATQTLYAGAVSSTRIRVWITMTKEININKGLR
jgi:hypothetical protein